MIKKFIMGLFLKYKDKLIAKMKDMLARAFKGELKILDGFIFSIITVLIFLLLFYGLSERSKVKALSDEMFNKNVKINSLNEKLNEALAGIESLSSENKNLKKKINSYSKSADELIEIKESIRLFVPELIDAIVQDECPGPAWKFIEDLRRIKCFVKK